MAAVETPPADHPGDVRQPPVVPWRHKGVTVLDVSGEIQHNKNMETKERNMKKLLALVTIAVLATGCASPAQRAAYSERRAAEMKQQELALANETEYQCVQREWKDINTQYAVSGVLAGFGGSTAENMAQKKEAMKNAAYLCSLKVKK
jgi:hypothetical protein